MLPPAETNAKVELGLVWKKARESASPGNGMDLGAFCQGSKTARQMWAQALWSRCLELNLHGTLAEVQVPVAWAGV